MRAGWLAALAALTYWTAGAQDAGLRVTTHYVELSVVVQTRRGEPVRDLKKEDFVVLDEGRPTRIAVFRSDGPGTPAPPARALPPGVFSNRIGLGTASNAIAILFDGLNTRFVDQAYARQQILTFLRRLPPGERVALYVLGRGPRVLQEFTDDPAALAPLLANDGGKLSPSLDTPLYEPGTSAPVQFDAWLGELTFNLFEHFAAERAFRTVRTLVAVANHLERLPGRKNLLWVAGNFPVSLDVDSAAAVRRRSERRVTPAELDRAIRALSRANVAVYPVDARGLIAQQDYTGPILKPEVRNPDTSMFGPMNMLADRTGGRAFYNNNDLAGALRRAQEDARASYLLGFYPSHNAWNGRFRRIEVRVQRPEVELRYRRGYFAQPDEPTEPWYRERVLDAALWSPLDATGLGLTVQLSPPGLLLQVDARDLSFRPKDGNWESSVDTWLVQLDRHERQIKADARTNNLRLDAKTYRQVIETGGLALPQELNVSPNAVLLRVLARDIATGALGSLTVPLGRNR